MEKEDIVFSVFIIGFLVTSLEILGLALWKIYEIYQTNQSIFYGLLVFPAITLISLIIALRID